MLRLYLGIVAISPQERMGCFPVSRTIMLFFDCVEICLRIGSTFRKPKHFWKYSNVTTLLTGSVELTRSSGGIQGVSCTPLSRMDVKAC